MDFSKYQKYSSEIIEAHKYHMETRGFNVFPDFFSENICNQLKKTLQNSIDNFVPFGNERSKKDAYHMHDLLNKDIIYGKMLEDPRLHQILAAILDDFWIMYAFTSSSLPPKGTNYGSRIHVDCPRHIPNYSTNIGIIWTLDDFTKENGGTKVLPASHHSNKNPTEELFEKNCQLITCKMGSLVVFNARTFHRAGENTTDFFRHSLTMNACRPYMKQRCDWVRFVPTEITDQLNENARRILGFDTRIPSSLEEFFMPDDKRLYKPNQE